MTVQEFCTYFTKVGELVAIREGGYVRSLVLINREYEYEDIFVIPESNRYKEVITERDYERIRTNNHKDAFVIPECYRDKEVVSDSWDIIDTIYENGTLHEVPCHYVDIEG